MQRRLSRAPEGLVADLQEALVRPERRFPGDGDGHAVQRLDAVHQRWPVLFSQQIGAHLHDVVGSNAEEVAVEGGVMELAQRQPVRDGWFSLVGVGHDVRGVEQLRVPETAEGALAPVGVEDALPKRALVEALPDRGRALSRSSCTAGVCPPAGCQR